MYITDYEQRNNASPDCLIPETFSRFFLELFCITLKRSITNRLSHCLAIVSAVFPRYCGEQITKTPYFVDKVYICSHRNE